METCCKFIANQLRGQQPETIKKIFNIDDENQSEAGVEPESHSEDLPLSLGNMNLDV